MSRVPEENRVGKGGGGGQDVAVTPPPTVGWTAWKPKKNFLRFWVLLDLIRSEIAIKHVFAAYKVHRIALEVSKVNPAWAKKTQFYLVIFSIFGCYRGLQGSHTSF